MDDVMRVKSENRNSKSNTYTQIYLQIVFAVKGRQCFIDEENRAELQKYLTGIIQNRSHKMLSIYCMPDHVHLLVGLKPTMAISDLVRDIKAISSQFISAQNWKSRRFSWQEGYGAFSYSKSQIDQVVKYILNQAEHHKKHSFRDEYVDFLKKFEIEFEEKYLFEWYD